MQFPFLRGLRSNFSLVRLFFPPLCQWSPQSSVDIYSIPAVPGTERRIAVHVSQYSVMNENIRPFRSESLDLCTFEPYFHILVQRLNFG